jgi:hypothetical protein
VRSDDQDGIHLAVALGADRLPPPLGAPAALRAHFARRAVVGASSQAGADERLDFLGTVSWSWLRFALVVGMVMVGLAYVGHLLAGDTGRNAGLAIGASVGFFCLTGAVYSIWKTVWAVRARSRARRYGFQDPTYLRVMARTTLHNTSLAAQTVVGVVTFYLVLTRA